MKKIVFLLIFLFVCSGLFAKNIEISFWHSMGFHVKEFIEEMVREYNKTHPGVTVTPVFQGLYEELQVKMLASAVTHQLPDIAQVQFEYLETYIANGLVEPIDGEISPEDRADIPEKLWDLVRRDGKIYGVPFCVSTTVFFYNEDAFRKAGLDANRYPSTWEEMINIGKLLTRDTDGDGVTDRYAMMFWLDGFYGFLPFLWANGGEILSNDGKRIVLTSPEMVKTMMMLRDLVYKYRIMPQKWTDWEGGQAFLRGNLAMGPFTSSVITYGEQNLPWKLRIAPMPSINGKRYTVLAGSGLVDFSSSKKKRKAVDDFMFWLINKENTIRLHKIIGSIPVRTSALNSLELRAFHKENPNYRVPIESLEFAKPLPILVEYYKINKRLRDMLQRIFMEGADVVTELKKAENDVNTMIY